MYIQKGEEEHTDEEDWVDADGNVFDLFEIDKNWKYLKLFTKCLTKTLKQNNL